MAGDTKELTALITMGHYGHSAVGHYINGPQLSTISATVWTVLQPATLFLPRPKRQKSVFFFSWFCTACVTETPPTARGALLETHGVTTNCTT